MFGWNWPCTHSHSIRMFWVLRYVCQCLVVIPSCATIQGKLFLPITMVTKNALRVSGALWHLEVPSDLILDPQTKIETKEYKLLALRLSPLIRRLGMRLTTSGAYESDNQLLTTCNHDWVTCMSFPDPAKLSGLGTYTTGFIWFHYFRNKGRVDRKLFPQHAHTNHCLGYTTSSDYSIVGNFQWRKLPRISESTIIAEKTFANSHKTVKFSPLKVSTIQ